MLCRGPCSAPSPPPPAAPHGPWPPGLGPREEGLAGGPRPPPQSSSFTSHMAWRPPPPPRPCGSTGWRPACPGWGAAGALTPHWDGHLRAAGPSFAHLGREVSGTQFPDRRGGREVKPQPPAEPVSLPPAAVPPRTKASVGGVRRRAARCQLEPPSPWGRASARGSAASGSPTPRPGAPLCVGGKSEWRWGRGRGRSPGAAAEAAGASCRQTRRWCV